jgi:hypothetical protein
VLVALSEEAGRRGEGEFYASYHVIGTLMGLVDNDKKVQRHVRALGQMGYISLLEAGDRGTVPGRMASRWSRWNSPARPGETLWNDHRAIGKGWARRPAAPAAAEVHDVAKPKTDGADPAVTGGASGAGLADPAGPVGDRLAQAGPADRDEEGGTPSQSDVIPYDPACRTPPALAEVIAEILASIRAQSTPDDDDYDFLERAAIMEFDGALSREQAERAAGYAQSC